MQFIQLDKSSMLYSKIIWDIIYGYKYKPQYTKQTAQVQ